MTEYLVGSSAQHVRIKANRPKRIAKSCFGLSSSLFRGRMKSRVDVVSFIDLFRGIIKHQQKKIVNKLWSVERELALCNWFDISFLGTLSTHNPSNNSSTKDIRSDIMSCKLMAPGGRASRPPPFLSRPMSHQSFCYYSVSLELFDPKKNGFYFNKSFI